MTGATATIETESLWEEFHGELLAFARPRLASDSEAEDLLQVAFLRMHQQLESGQAPTNVRAWMYRIVRNLVVDTYRKAARRREVSDPDPASNLEVIDESDSLDTDDEARQVLARTLPIFIENLRSPYREALQLTELEGLTQAEAAARVGVSVSGMKSRVQRARKMLLEALHECCEFAIDARSRVVACEARDDDDVCCSGG